MPIIINKTTIVPRLRHKTQEIWRVFKGSKLVHGLFKAFYKKPASAGNIQSGGFSAAIDDTNNPDLFTWGIGTPSLTQPTLPSGVTFVKWCSDPNVMTQVTSIDKNTQQDTTLYSKVYIEGVQYRVTYGWWD